MKSISKNCEECNGSGRDEAATKAMYKRESSSTGYIRCWNCNGNGLNPAYFFRWSSNET